MNLNAGEMDELAFLARDICHGARGQLHAEDDAKAYSRMGRLWRTSKDIAWVCGLLFVGLVCGAAVASLCGCAKADDAAERMRVLAAYMDAETADVVSEKQAQIADGEVRTREPEGPLSECPSPCIIKVTATWCRACQREGVSAWVEKSGWAVHTYDYDRDATFCQALDVKLLPTFIVIRGHKEVARYTGTDIKAFLPILKAACQ